MGNTATGASAIIGLTSSGVSYTSNPQLTLNNTNSAVGNNTVYSFLFVKLYSANFINFEWNEHLS